MSVLFTYQKQHCFRLVINSAIYSDFRPGNKFSLQDLVTNFCKIVILQMEISSVEENFLHLTKSFHIVFYYFNVNLQYPLRVKFSLLISRYPSMFRMELMIYSQNSEFFIFQSFPNLVSSKPSIPIGWKILLPPLPGWVHTGSITNLISLAN